MDSRIMHVTYTLYLEFSSFILDATRKTQRR
jgi:hypothetical protein